MVIITNVVLWSMVKIKTNLGFFDTDDKTIFNFCKIINKIIKCNYLHNKYFIYNNNFMFLLFSSLVKFDGAILMEII